MSMIPTVTASIGGTEFFASKMGLLYVSFSPGGLASPPLAGLAYDRTGSFVPMQLMTGVAFVAGLAWLVGLRIASGREIDRRIKAGEVVKEKWIGKVRAM